VRVKEFLERYCDVSMNNEEQISASIEFTEGTISSLRSRTNLRDVNG